MKYLKILITPLSWHLLPYKVKHDTISPNPITEFGWLCLKLIITWKYKSKHPIK